MAPVSAKWPNMTFAVTLALANHVNLGEKLDVPRQARDSREHLVEVGSGQMLINKPPEIASNLAACACH